jgi:hypothetical protein
VAPIHLPPSAVNGIDRDLQLAARDCDQQTPTAQLSGRNAQDAAVVVIDKRDR